MKITSLTIFLIITMGLVISCTSQEKKEVVPPKLDIHQAVFMGSLKEVEAHIAFGSDLDVKDAYGSTPINIASTFGHTEIAKSLLEGGANPNVINGDGSTALHSASFFCYKDIVASLLEAGVDPSVRNSYGSTAGESVSAPFAAVKAIYDQMGRDLGPLGLKLDYAEVEKLRPQIAAMIANYETQD